MPGNSAQSNIDRREFCNHVLLGSAGVVLAASSLKATPAAQPGDKNVVSYPPMKIDGAERVMPGSFLYFDYPKRDDLAVLVRNSEGQYIAFSRKCAHLGCSIEFDSMRQCLACPCHRGVYDPRTGYVVYGPPPRPLDQIILQMRAGGEVWAVGRTFTTNEDRA
jgi:Rieske Fe-S protein